MKRWSLSTILIIICFYYTSYYNHHNNVNALAVEVRKIGPTIWKPLDIKVERGLRQTYLSIPVRDHCKWLRLLPLKINHAQIGDIFNETLSICESNRKKKFEFKLNSIVNLFKQQQLKNKSVSKKESSFLNFNSIKASIGQENDDMSPSINSTTTTTLISNNIDMAPEIIKHALKTSSNVVGSISTNPTTTTNTAPLNTITQISSKHQDNQQQQQQQLKSIDSDSSDGDNNLLANQKSNSHHRNSNEPSSLNKIKMMITIPPTLQINNGNELLERINFTLPETKDIGQSEVNYWLTYIVPSFESIWQRYDDSSESNTVKKHNSLLKMLTQMSNNHTANFNAMSGIQSQVFELISKLTKNVEQIGTSLSTFHNVFAKLEDLSTKSSIAVQRDTDILTELDAYFQQGKLNTIACAKLIDNSSAYSSILGQSWYAERTVLNNFELVNNYMIFDYHEPILDLESRIYESYQMKKWINMDKYILCEGKEWLLYNETINCTRKIDDPRLDVISKNCLRENYKSPSTILMNMNTSSCHEHEVKNSKEAREEALEPTVIQAGDFFVIQCYLKNITIQNSNYACPRHPIAISTKYSFEVEGYNHKFSSSSFKFDPDQTEDDDLRIISQSISVGENPFANGISEIMNALDMAKHDHTEFLKDLERQRRIQLNEQLTGTNLNNFSLPSLSAVGVVVILVYYKFFAGNRNLDRMETMVVAGLAQSAMSKSRESVHSGKSYVSEREPSINICIQNPSIPAYHHNLGNNQTSHFVSFQDPHSREDDQATAQLRSGTPWPKS